MGRLLLLLMLVILPACIGQAHYVHNTDTQATQQRAAQAEASRNAQQEAALYGMMGQLGSMASQTTPAMGPPWTSSPGYQAFVKQAQGGSQQEAATNILQIMNQLSGQAQGGDQQEAAASILQLINQFGGQAQGGGQQQEAAATIQQLIHQFGGQAQGGGQQQEAVASIQQILSHLGVQAQPNQQGFSQQGQGGGSEFDLINRFIQACQAGDNTTATSLLAEATTRFSTNPQNQAALNQMQGMVNTTTKTSSSNSAVPIKSGYTGFQAAQSSTMQTRQIGSGFQPARQGVTRTAQESTPKESAGETMTAQSDAPKSQIGFMGIAPGAGSSADIQSHLGAPVKRESKGTEYFKSSGQGIAEAIVTYDDLGVVRFARIRLVNQLPPELAEIAFQVMGPAGQSEGSLFTDNETEGWTAHYIDKGIHFYVQNGIVRDVWMTVPDQDLSIVRLD